MDTIDILKELVESLSFTIPVDNIVNNSDGTYTLNVGESPSDCKKHTYHVTGTNCTVQLNGKDYKVKSVVNNVSITVKPINEAHVPVTPMNFPVAAPQFKHGTLVEVNSELTAVDHSSENFPMIYLLERFTEDHTNASDRGQIVDRTAQVRLFALDISKLEDWKISDRLNQCIRPMQNLLDELIDAFNDSKIIGTFDSYRITTIPFFGIYNANEGETEQLFDQLCSGAELGIALPIERDFSCNNC